MKILNVGCGEDTYGTDFIDKYPTRAEVIKCDVDEEPLPYKSGAFDWVYCKNLLEHLGNPLDALREMHRVLKVEGHLELITDNAGYWSFHAWYSKFHYSTKFKGLRGKEDRHFTIYTIAHLRNLFERVGFHIVFVRGWNDEAGWFEKPISWILRCIGFRRMSYQKLKIVGRK
jgi:Methylase involved in ubiquinone/menaquinone biosynthesis